VKRYFFIFAALLCAIAGFSQEKQDVQSDFESPKWAVKTNALYWLTTTPNLGIETVLSNKLSLDVSMNYNPWKFGKSAKFRHFLIQPEIRYWIDSPTKGHFVGVHVHYADVDIDMGFVSLLPDVRKKGHLYGVGALYGYSWELGNKWRLEGLVGLGYAHLKYRTYTDDGHKMNIYDYYNYVGPTKLAVNLVYIIK
jgi:hypothetical protein